MAVAHRARDHFLSIEGVLDLARKNLVRAVLRVALAELVAVALTERPETTTLRNDGSGYRSTFFSGSTVRSRSHKDALLSLNLLHQMRKGLIVLGSQTELAKLAASPGTSQKMNTSYQV